MGRVLWTIRRPGFYGVIVLLFALFCGISCRQIATAAFPSNQNFNLFFAYLFWSAPTLIITTLLSVIYAKSWGDKAPIVIVLAKFFANDIISPIFCIIQLPLGLILRLLGDEVDWFGCFFDFFWTIAWLVYIMYGVVTTFP